MDLSSFSNEELLAIAGASSVPSNRGYDLSNFTDQELLDIAGVSPSIGSEIAGVGRRFGEGALDLVSLAESASRNLNPLQVGGPRLFGLNENIYNQGDDRLINAGREQLAKIKEPQTAAGKIAGEIAYYAPSVFMPGGSMASRVASVFGAGTAAGAAKASGAGETGQAIAGLVGSLTPAGASRAARKAGSVFSSAGKSLERSAYGANQTRIRKAIDKMPDVLDDAEEWKNPISEALESFRRDGGGKSLDPNTLLKEVGEQQDAYIAALRSELEPASLSAMRQNRVIVPDFKFTNEYVSKLAGVQKGPAKEKAAKIIKDTVDNLDGTLLSLQDEKVKLTSAIRDSAYGDDANPIVTNILKRVRADLRNTIETEFQSITGKPKNIIADLNKEIGKREGLYPLFKDMRVNNESRDVIKWAMQNMRTSSGFGVPIGAAMGATGGSALAGVGAGLTGAAMASPPGRKVLGDASKAIGRAASAASSIAPQVGAGSVAQSIGRLNQDASEPSSTAQEFQRTLLPPSRKNGPYGSQSSQTNRVPKRGESFPSLNAMPIAPETQAIFDKIRGEMKNPQNDQEFSTLMKAIEHVESRGNPKAVSHKGAVGTHQVMPIAMREVMRARGEDDSKYSDADLRKLATQPGVSEEFGTAYFQMLMDRFGDVQLALAAYNGGPSRVASLLKKTNGSSFDDIKSKLPAETQKYVPSIEKVFEKLLQEA